jgi:Family of unknown function (DUF6516)
MDLTDYLVAIRKKLDNSEIVTTLSIVDERALFNRGYFRARIFLSNGDFLELAESFTLQDGKVVTRDYRYQWMDGSRQILRKRWDSVKHFPGLPNFPHHVHVGSESNVEASVSRNILELLDLLASQL